jgi:hypothetical protein
MRSVKRTSRDNTTETKRHGWLIVLAVFVLLLGTLSYGLARIFSFATASSSPQITLIVTSSTEDNQTKDLWMLVAGKSDQTRYYHLAKEAVYATGLTTNFGSEQAATIAAQAQTTEQQQAVLSQTLGLPVARILHFDRSFKDWLAIRDQLRSIVSTQLKEGDVSVEALQIWLAARTAQGESDPIALRAIINQLDRMNLAAVESKENCPVAVLNNSGRARYASQVGQVIEQNGGTVVRIANALGVGELESIDQQKTMIVMRPGTTQSCTNTLSLVSAFFPQATTLENMVIADQYRADAVLILGANAASADVTVIVPNLHQ